MLRLRDVLASSVFDAGDVNWKNLKAILILAALLAIVIVLTVGCIVVPLVRTEDRAIVARAARRCWFFSAPSVSVSSSSRWHRCSA